MWISYRWVSIRTWLYKSRTWRERFLRQSRYMTLGSRKISPYFSFNMCTAVASILLSKSICNVTCVIFVLFALWRPLVLLRSGRSLEPYTCASIVEKLPRNPKMFQAIAYIRGALAGHIQLSQVKYPGGNLGDTFIDMSAFRNKQRNVPSPAGQGVSLINLCTVGNDYLFCVDRIHITTLATYFLQSLPPPHPPPPSPPPSLELYKINWLSKWLN